MTVNRHGQMLCDESVPGVGLCDLGAQCSGGAALAHPTIERVDIGPEASAALHCHKQFDQFFLVISGEGVLHGIEGSRPLAPQDFFVLPRGLMRALTAEAKGMSLLSVSSPEFVSGDVHYL